MAWLPKLSASSSKGQNVRDEPRNFFSWVERRRVLSSPLNKENKIKQKEQQPEK